MSVVSAVLSTLRLAVPLYLTTLVLGLLPTAAAMVGLVPLAGDRPWRVDLLSAGWMNLAAEIVMSAVYTRDAAQLVLLLVVPLLLLLLALLGQLIAYSFLAGGIVESLRGRSVVWASFWTACRCWFWPFLRLSLLGGILVIFAVVLGAVVSTLARPLIGPDIAALLQYALQAIVFGWLELSRALMVTESDRSVGAAMGRAGRIGLRPLVLLIWLLISLPSAGLVVAALVPPTVNDPHAPGELVQALLFGQVVAFIGAWIKVVRLAVATRIALAVRPTLLRADIRVSQGGAR